MMGGRPRYPDLGRSRAPGVPQNASPTTSQRIWRGVVMPVIDADAHVIETERTWEFMADSEAGLRPTAVMNMDPNAPSRLREFWSIDGRLFPRRAFDVDKTGTSEETRELQSIEARLRHMDELGVDVHVLYPTLFLSPVTNRPEVEAALYKSYNRWLADIWSKSNGRLLWAVMV